MYSATNYLTQHSNVKEQSPSYYEVFPELAVFLHCLPLLDITVGMGGTY
jgi:hypothetical protein